MSHKISKATANKLLEDLDDIRCPYTCDIDAAFIAEVLFEPNDHRLQILKWMICSIHPDVENLLQSGRSVFSGKTNLEVDPQIQIFTSLCSTMCLCTPAEFDLIRGRASTNRQLSFWRQLINMVKEVKAPCPNKNEVLNKILQHDGLTGCSNLDRMFNSGSILPPDIMKAISISQKIVKWNKLKPSTSSKLKEELTELENIIKQEQELLEDMKTKSSYVTKDDTNISVAVNKAYKLDLVDLSQMIDAFQQIYINTFKPICNRKPEKFTELGEKINDVNKLLRILSETLQNLKLIQSHFTSIANVSEHLEYQNIVKGNLQPVDCLQSLCETAHSTFNLTYSTFEKDNNTTGTGSFRDKILSFNVQENTGHTNNTVLSEIVNSIAELK